MKETLDRQGATGSTPVGCRQYTEGDRGLVVVAPPDADSPQIDAFLSHSTSREGVGSSSTCSCCSSPRAPRTSSRASRRPRVGHAAHATTARAGGEVIQVEGVEWPAGTDGLDDDDADDDDDGGGEGGAPPPRPRRWCARDRARRVIIDDDDVRAGAARRVPRARRALEYGKRDTANPFVAFGKLGAPRGMTPLPVNADHPSTLQRGEGHADWDARTTRRRRRPRAAAPSLVCCRSASLVRERGFGACLEICRAFCGRITHGAIHGICYI